MEFWEVMVLIMEFWEVIILIVCVDIVFKIRRLRRRVLYLEQRWAEQQRRRSMYSELIGPTENALRTMGDFGIEDIENAVTAEQIKKRTKTGKSWLQRLLDEAEKAGRL